MARTPSDPPQNKDEKEIFHLLKDRLSDEWVFWHEPELKRSYDDSLRPDFILLHPKRGLFVLEVKGWVADNILDVKKNQMDGSGIGRKRDKVQYKFGDGPEWKDAPFDQLRNYTSQVGKRLRKLPQISNKKANKLFKGAVCFVRIARDDLKTDSIFETRLNKLRKDVLTSKRNEQGYYEGDYQRWRAYSNELQKSLSASPDEDLQLDEEIRTQIRGLIHPESVIQVPSPLGESHSEPAIHAESDAEPVPRILDLDQEEVARRYVGQGHRILFGVAGSGKTVILIARARYQAMRHPEQHILVLCFNRTLSFYIRDALKDYQNIVVNTFHSWAWSNCPNYWDFTEDERDKNLLIHLERGGVKQQYDCILIDESQDWRLAWFKAVLHAAKDAEKGDMLIVGDGSQSIYAKHQGFTWKACGIKARGRVINRRGGKVNTFRNYRNTPEIVALATSFARGRIQEDTAPKDGMMSLLPKTEECGKQKSGNLPVICWAQDKSAELNLVWGEIRYLLRNGLVAQYSDIAIVYPHAHSEQAKSLLLRLTNYLKQHYQADHIESNEKNQNAILADTIKISNVHQIKGLEFKVCFVIWANDFKDDEGHLLYVALTRATDHLYVTHHTDTPLTRELTSDLALYTEDFLHKPEREQ